MRWRHCDRLGLDHSAQQRGRHTVQHFVLIIDPRPLQKSQSARALFWQHDPTSQLPQGTNPVARSPPQ